MKTKHLSILLVALALSLFAGCASVGSSNTKNLLSAAGFRVRIPETPEQKSLFVAAPAYQVQRITFNNHTFYAYKDEKEGIAYVGDEMNYQHYQQLAIEQHLAQQQYQAAEMQRSAATSWYGAYGPSVYGRHTVHVRHR